MPQLRQHGGIYGDENCKRHCTAYSLIGLLYAGGPVLLTAMLVISLIGLYEFYRALSNQHKPFQIIGLAAAILYYGVLLFREEWVRDGNFGLFSSSVCFGF
ncbi:MAG: hypothetical protein ACLR23_12630 [Clostridia bacterium]